MLGKARNKYKSTSEEGKRQRNKQRISLRRNTEWAAQRTQEGLSISLQAPASLWVAVLGQRPLTLEAAAGRTNSLASTTAPEHSKAVGQGNCVRYHLGSGWHWRKWTWFMAGLQDLAGPWIPQLTADLLLVNVVNWYIYYPNTVYLSPLNVISAGFCLGLSHPVIARLPLQKVGRLPAGFAWSPYIFLSIWTGCWLCLGAYNTPSGLCSEKSFATTNICPFKIDFQ